MREMLCYQLFRDMGSYAPRGVFVYLLSDAYERFGAKNQYGWWSSSANTAGRQCTFDMSLVDYPAYCALSRHFRIGPAGVPRETLLLTQHSN